MRFLITRRRGFTLLPVMLAVIVVAAVALLLNRQNGFNARMLTQQAETERARYAAEAGLQAANFTVQAAGCSGMYPTAATPVSGTNFGGASYSAHSTTGSGNPLTLVSTGTYNGTSVTLTRANVLVYQPRQTALIQPGSGVGLDAHVNSEFPDRNYGGENMIRLQTGRFQSLIKFDLSVYPAGTRVIPWYDTASGTLKPGATLSLYQTQGGSSSPAFANLHLITRGWTEGTQSGSSPANGATWNTYDGVNTWSSPGVGYTPAPAASLAHTTSLGWKDWDVTAAVAGWMSGVYPNHGLWLVDSGGSIGDTIYTSSEGAASQRPRLTLSYLQPCGQGITFLAAADTYLRSGTSFQDLNYGGAPLVDVNYPTPERRILLRFDLSSIPAGTTIQSAIMRVYCSNVISPTNNAKTLNAYFITESWVEGTLNGSGTANGATWRRRDGVVNWSSTGGTYYNSWVVPGREEASGSTPLPGGFRQGWVTFDITAAVQYWVDNGPTSNFGMLVRMPNSSPSDIIEFDSRESTGGMAPRLVVVLQ